MVYVAIYFWVLTEKEKIQKIKREYLEEIQKIIAVRRECQSA